MTPKRQADESFERTLPHSLEAEKAVIGAILLHNDAYLEASRHVRSGDFFRDGHRRIVAALERILDAKGGAADLLTLRHELTRTGDLDEVGGPAYIASLTDGVPRSTNVGHYARIVKAKSVLRALIYAGNKTVTDAYIAEDPPEEILARADRALLDIAHGSTTGRMRAVRQTSSELLDALEWRVKNRGKLTGVPTGFETIDALTMGWQAGEMIVVAARPSIGKTTFVLNSIRAACLAGVRTALFSLEMRRQQLEFRMISSASGIALSSILGGWISDAQYGPLSMAIGELSELPLCIDDTASRTVWDIRGECRRMKANGGLGLVVIDYVQLMAGTLERKGANRNEEITDISRRLKVLADDLSLPVILLSQLNRAGEGRSDPRPKLSDLRESGALEQDADMVCFLHRKNHRESGLTSFIIEKARNGPTGTVRLNVHRETTTFTDAGLEPEEATLPLAAAEPTPADDQEARVKAIIRNRSRRKR